MTLSPPADDRPQAARIWTLPPAAPSAPLAAPPHRPLAGVHREAEVRRRARGDAFGPVGDDLRVSVALDVSADPAALASLVASLAAQDDGAGSPFARGEAEALVALVGPDAAAAAALVADVPWLRATVVPRAPANAGVAWARQLAMDAACVRLLAAGRPEGWVLTTSVPQPAGWLGRTEEHAAEGTDAAFGGSLAEGAAVTARAYAHVGGLPARDADPSRGLARALADAGARVLGPATAPRPVGRPPLLAAS